MTEKHRVDMMHWIEDQTCSCCGAEHVPICCFTHHSEITKGFKACYDLCEECLKFAIQLYDEAVKTN